MDPKACLLLVNDGDSDALIDLARWLFNGGFFPCGEAGEEMHPTIADEGLEHFTEDSGFRALACSVRVALAYGDMSGLEYLMSSQF